VKASSPAIKEAQAAVKDATAAASCFATGPRATFNELRERSVPVEEEHAVDDREDQSGAADATDNPAPADETTAAA